jgi:hypothetical protein
MEEMTHDLCLELMNLKWPRNYERKSVLQEGQKCYEAFVLGDIWSWAHRDVKETGARIQKSRRHKEQKYDRIWELTQEIGEGLKYTSVQFNKNQKCKKHIDGKNTGISTIIGLGDYEGGELLIYYDGEDKEPTAVDIKGRLYEFDGSKYYHETASFKGNRFSLVYFNREF